MLDMSSCVQSFPNEELDPNRSVPLLSCRRDSLFIAPSVCKSVILAPCFNNLAAESMEQVVAKLLRFATELKLVRGQVQTECNALPDPFERTRSANETQGSASYPALEWDPRRPWRVRLSDGGECSSVLAQW